MHTRDMKQRLETLRIKCDFPFSSCFFADNPKFTGPILNITVPVGREAQLECGVDDLSNFKVSNLINLSR